MVENESIWRLDPQRRQPFPWLMLTKLLYGLILVLIEACGHVDA